jgi:hypothetical protein
MFQLTREQYECIARTFREVFPEALLIRGDFYAEMPIVGLFGGRTTSSLDWDRIGEACLRLRIDGRCLDPLLRHAEGIAMCVIGDLPDAGSGPVNTLANGWLEWNAGRNVVGLREPWFTGAPYVSYVRSTHGIADEGIPPRLRDAHRSGQMFLNAELLMAANLPEAGEYAALVRASLPASLRYDQAAVWRHWPMRHRVDGR